MAEPFVLVGTHPSAWCMEQCLSTPRVESSQVMATLASCCSPSRLLIPYLLYSMFVGRCRMRPRPPVFRSEGPYSGGRRRLQDRRGSRRTIMSNSV